MINLQDGGAQILYLREYTFSHFNFGKKVNKYVSQNVKLSPEASFRDYLQRVVVYFLMVLFYRFLLVIKSSRQMVQQCRHIVQSETAANPMFPTTCLPTEMTTW